MKINYYYNNYCSNLQHDVDCKRRLVDTYHMGDIATKTTIILCLQGSNKRTCKCSKDSNVNHSCNICLAHDTIVREQDGCKKGLQIIAALIADLYKCER